MILSSCLSACVRVCMCVLAVADPGVALETRPIRPIFFISMSFSAKTFSNNRLVYPHLWGWRPLWEILDPPQICCYDTPVSPPLRPNHVPAICVTPAPTWCFGMQCACVVCVACVSGGCQFVIGGAKNSAKMEGFHSWPCNGKSWIQHWCRACGLIHATRVVHVCVCVRGRGGVFLHCVRNLRGGSRISALGRQPYFICLNFRKKLYEIKKKYSVWGNPLSATAKGSRGYNGRRIRVAHPEVWQGNQAGVETI